MARGDNRRPSGAFAPLADVYRQASATSGLSVDPFENNLAKVETVPQPETQIPVDPIERLVHIV